MPVFSTCSLSGVWLGHSINRLKSRWYKLTYEPDLTSVSIYQLPAYKTVTSETHSWNSMDDIDELLDEAEKVYSKDEIKSSQQSDVNDPVLRYKI